MLVMAEAGWAGQREVTIATCGCQEKAVKWSSKNLGTLERWHRRCTCP